MHNGEIHLSSCWVGIYARAPVIMNATYVQHNFWDLLTHPSMQDQVCSGQLACMEYDYIYI